MRIIRNSKDITTLEVDDVVIISNFRHVVCKHSRNGSPRYYLNYCLGDNDRIFEILNFKKRDFIAKLGIDADCNCDFPETKSLEALTAIVSALLKESEKQKKLPKTWEEFCRINDVAQGESFIGLGSEVHLMKGTYRRDSVSDKNICTSGPEAAAFLTLIQLRQLRKAYVKDWEPNWDNNDPKYCIICDSNQFDIINCYHLSSPLSFPTEILANQFLTNFKDLLEVAKPLL